MSPKAQDKIVEAMLARLQAGAVTLDGAKKIDLRGASVPVLIGLVCDHEPLLHTHQSLATHYPDRVVRGLAAAAVICGAQRALLAVDEGWGDLLETFRGEASGTLLEVVPVPARYPMDPASLVCDLAQLRGKSVPAAGLGHALVLDAVTLCDVAVALEGRFPLRRTVTVAGQVNEPAVLQVPPPWQTWWEPAAAARTAAGSLSTTAFCRAAPWPRTTWCTRTPAGWWSCPTSTPRWCAAPRRCPIWCGECLRPASIAASAPTSARRFWRAASTSLTG